MRVAERFPIEAALWVRLQLQPLDQVPHLGGELRGVVDGSDELSQRRRRRWLWAAEAG